MSVAATRWQQDTHLQPNNPNQLIRFSPTWPSGGDGYSAFGWSPVANPGFKLYSPSGVVGLGAPLVPGWSGVAKVVGAGLGILAGVWLAVKNLE
jgi:hypothetical protein